jgi:hypothetical protein
MNKKQHYEREITNHGEEIEGVYISIEGGQVRNPSPLGY